MARRRRAWRPCPPAFARGRGQREATVCLGARAPAGSRLELRLRQDGPPTHAYTHRARPRWLHTRSVAALYSGARGPLSAHVVVLPHLLVEAGVHLAAGGSERHGQEALRVLRVFDDPRVHAVVARVCASEHGGRRSARWRLTCQLTQPMHFSSTTRADLWATAKLAGRPAARGPLWQYTQCALQLRQLIYGSRRCRRCARASAKWTPA